MQQADDVRFHGATALEYLAGLSTDGDAYYRRVPQIVGDGAARFEGTVAEFVAAHPDLAEQMRNDAMVCPRCAKTNATILRCCNGCGESLAGAARQFTENVCMAFLYGIASCSRGPLKLSLRSEDREVLVYDDLLARGSCHLNAIPAACHLPDWRHLLRSPARGRELLGRLEAACWRVVVAQFWGDEAWRTTNFREGAFASAEDLRSQIHVGMNSVPSQFQVHLQYIVPAIQPADYHAFLHGKRFVKERWLPLEYVTESLAALESSGGLPHAHDMAQEDIFAAVAAAGGPVYEEAYGKAIRRYNQTHRRCANWRPEHFDVVVVSRHPALRAELLGAAADSVAEEVLASEVRALRSCDVAPAAAALSPADLERRDKRAIQSYGRPYDGATGSPAAMSYYKFSREAGEILTADEWAARA